MAQFVSNLDIALIQRLYSAALKIVQEADESSEDVILSGDHFRELEIAVNSLRERQVLYPSF
jgi:hypothetical protein